MWQFFNKTPGSTIQVFCNRYKHNYFSSNFVFECLGRQVLAVGRVQNRIIYKLLQHNSQPPISFKAKANAKLAWLFKDKWPRFFPNICQDKAQLKNVLGIDLFWSSVYSNTVLYKLGIEQFQGLLIALVIQFNWTSILLYWNIIN